VKKVPLDAVKGYVLSPSCVALDADAITGDIMVRPRKPGDSFVPLGMKGHKKIKSLFIDDKIPFNEREKIMLVCDEEKIIWVENRRISELCKITEQTKNVMIISFQELVESK
jgi:tRNA(Ile)-lysidine synthase